MSKPTIPDVLPLALAYVQKPGNEAWGALHIVMEDGNYADDNVHWCLNSAVQAGDADGARLAMLLLHMSKTQRRKLAAKANAAPHPKPAADLPAVPEITYRLDGPGRSNEP